MAKPGRSLDSILDDLLKEDPSIDLGEIVNAETPHLPVVFLIDTSSSMTKLEGEETNIQRVNDNLKKFIADVEAGVDELYMKLRECGDFCVIAYGNGRATVVLPWTHGSRLRAASLPTLTASGDTPMHEAIVLAGDMMLERLRGYQKDDIEAYCGAVFNLTDGEPTDEKVQERAKKVVDLFETGTSAGKALVEFHHVGTPRHKRSALLALSVKPERVMEIGVNIADFFNYVVITFSGIAGDIGSAVALADWRAQKRD